MLPGEQPRVCMALLFLLIKTPKVTRGPSFLSIYFCLTGFSSFVQWTIHIPVTPSAFQQLLCALTEMVLIIPILEVGWTNIRGQTGSLQRPRRFSFVKKPKKRCVLLRPSVCLQTPPPGFFKPQPCCTGWLFSLSFLLFLTFLLDTNHSNLKRGNFHWENVFITLAYRKIYGEIFLIND